MKRLLTFVTIGLTGSTLWLALVGCGGGQDVPTEISDEQAQQYAEQSMGDLGMPQEVVEGEMPEDPAFLQDVSPGEGGSGYPGTEQRTGGGGNPYQ